MVRSQQNDTLRENIKEIENKQIRIYTSMLFISLHFTMAQVEGRNL